MWRRDDRRRCGLTRRRVDLRFGCERRGIVGDAVALRRVAGPEQSQNRWVSPEITGRFHPPSGNGLFKRLHGPSPGSAQIADQVARFPAQFGHFFGTRMATGQGAISRRTVGWLPRRLIQASRRGEPIITLSAGWP
jgi:hypothetical protein